MKLLSASLHLAGLLSFAATDIQVAHADDFYSRNEAQLKELPVHVILLNDDLRTQIAYGTSDIDPVLQQVLLQNAVNNSLAGVPGVSLGQAALAGAAGGLIMGVLAAKGEELQAEAVVEPAHTLLHASNCALPTGQQISQGVATGMKATRWGQGPAPHLTTLGPKQDVDDVLDEKAARHVLAVSFSMTPDFSTVVTSAKIDIYSPKMGNTDSRWASRPVHTSRLLVASDQVRIAPKSPSDIEAAISKENARFAAGPTQALIVKANGGDRAARKKALSQQWWHKRHLQEAQMSDWTPTEAALKRSQVWANDDCELLVAAVTSNNVELQKMVSALYGGDLPSGLAVDSEESPVDTLQPLAGEQDGVRMVHALPDSTYLSRRGGDYAALSHLYTWYQP